MQREQPPHAIPGRIAVVGPCAAGKSELVARLCALGYDARCCAQEHSYVPDMWRRLSRPEVLVYLDASLETIARRRQIDFGQDYLTEQQARLEHARAHCHIYVRTDALDLDGVLAAVLQRLCAWGVGRAQAAGSGEGDAGCGREAPCKRERDPGG